ncbi:MAG: STAS domain-containing protein [Nitrospirae bacterium]|nr:STAS domain-containing protein [Nitrospirota bacterium]
MKHEVVDNKILILQDELDIYDAPLLKEKITTVANTNNNSVVVDLHQVESISTPVIQILISAKKSLKDFNILNINDGIIRNLNLFGFSL